MKHYSPTDAERIDEPLLGQNLTDAELAQELLERAQRRPISGELLTQGQVTAELAQRLDGRRGEKGRLAEDLGIGQGDLSNILHGRYGISDEVARKLGYRRVIRFERSS